MITNPTKKNYNTKPYETKQRTTVKTSKNPANYDPPPPQKKKNTQLYIYINNPLEPPPYNPLLYRFFSILSPPLINPKPRLPRRSRAQ